MRRNKKSAMGQREIHRPSLLLMDVVLLVAAINLSSYLRVLLASGTVAFDPNPPVIIYGWISITWIATTFASGIYRRKYPSWLVELLFLSINALINTLALIGVYTLLMLTVSRLMFAFYFLFAISLIFLHRQLLRSFLETKINLRLSETLEQFWKKVVRLDERLYAKNIDLLLVAVGAVIFAFFNTHAGYAYSPDSVEYISMAARFRSSGEFGFLPYWPPLFPLLITLTSLIIPFPASAAVFIVSGSTICVLVIFAVLTRKSLRSAFLTILAVIALMGLRIFLLAGSTVWSEMLFLFFVFMSVNFTLSFRGSLNSRDVGLALAFAGLAALTRYIGSIQLVLVTLVVIWLSWRSRRPIPLVPIISVNAVFVLCLVLFRLRNDLVFGRDWFNVWMGPRGDLVADFLANVYASLRLLMEDVPLPFIVLLIVGLILVVLSFLGNREAETWISPAILLFFSAGYFVGLLYSSSIYTPVSIDSRLLLPGYLLLTLFAINVSVPSLGVAADHYKNEYLRFFAPAIVVVVFSWSVLNGTFHLVAGISDTAADGGKPNYHFNDGYRISSTSSYLAKILSTVLADEDSVDAFVLVPFETYGRIMFLQQDIFKQMDFSSVRYLYGEDQNYAVILEQMNGTEKMINYWFTSVLEDWYLPGKQDPNALQSAITQSISTSPPRFLVFFLTDADNVEVWESLVEQLSAEFSHVVHNAHPYQVGFFWGD